MPRNSGALTALQAALMGVSGGLSGYTKDQELRAEQEERARLIAEREAERKALAEERKAAAAEREQTRKDAATRFNAQQQQWAFERGLEDRSALDRALNAPNIVDVANAMPQPEGWMGKPLTFDREQFAPMAKRAEETLARGRRVDLPMADGKVAPFYQPFARTPEAELERAAAESAAKQKEKQKEMEAEAALRLKLNAPRRDNVESEIQKLLAEFALRVDPQTNFLPDDVAIAAKERQLRQIYKVPSRGPVGPTAAMGVTGPVGATGFVSGAGSRGGLASGVTGADAQSNPVADWMRRNPKRDDETREQYRARYLAATGGR